MVKNLYRKLALIILPLLASIIMRFLYLTNKKKFHTSDSIGEEPIIFACWHGELLMLPFLYARYRKVPKAKIFISSHFDGMLISKIVSYFGLKTISGSTTRGAVRILIQGIKALENGYDIGITPDGPKGPRYEVADGIIALAHKTKCKIVLLKVKPTKFWQLNSWDKFIIPKLFGTLNYYASSPIDISSLELEEARTLIKEGLNKHEA